MCFGSGGGSVPTETTVINQNIPDEMIGPALGVVDWATEAANRVYDPYTGQRLAWFSPTEQEGMSALAAFGMSGDNPNLINAGQMAYSSGSYNPMFGTSGYVADPYSVNYQYGQYSPGYAAGNIQSSYSPERYGMTYSGPATYQMNYQPGTYNSGYQAGEYTPGYQARDYQSQYQAGQFDPSGIEEIQTSRSVGFDPGVMNDQAVIDSYMSPYITNVLDPRLEAAQYESDKRIAQARTAAGGTGGATGNYRLAVTEGMEREDLSRLQDSIQSEARREALLNAQNMMLQDREGRRQLEQLEQGQFGLNTKAGLDAQRLGLEAFNLNQTAMQMEENLRRQGFSEAESARQVEEQFGQDAWGMIENARQAEETFNQNIIGMNESFQQAYEGFAQSAFSENEAAKQAFENLSQQGYSIDQAAQQVAQQFGLDAFRLNEQAKQAEEDFKQNAFGMNEAAKQAYENFRQSGYSIEQAAMQAQEGLIQSQFGLNMQDRQFGADIGLQASNQLAMLSQLQQAQELERLNTLMNVGSLERQMMQAGLDMGYQDYLAQIGAERDAISWLTSIIYGNPMMQTGTQTTTSTMPSYSNPLLSAGLGALPYIAGRQPPSTTQPVETGIG
jgi:hypothetical protein